MFLCTHMGLGIFLGVPLGAVNYFQSPGNIPTSTSQFLQAPRCLCVVLLAQWQVLFLRVSKYYWMWLLGFYLLVLQHNTATPLDSLTLLSLVIFSLHDINISLRYIWPQGSTFELLYSVLCKFAQTRCLPWDLFWCAISDHFLWYSFFFKHWF